MITLQRFVGFCHTTKQINHNYIHIPSLLSLPPAPPSHPFRSSECQVGLPVSYSSSPLAISHMVVCLCQCYFHNVPTLSCSCVFKSILDICVFIPSLKIGSSVPAVNVLIKEVRETTTLMNNISDTSNGE